MRSRVFMLSVIATFLTGAEVLFALPATAKETTTIDSHSDARLIATGGKWFYWVDKDKTELRRSQIEKGTLPDSKREIIASDFNDIGLAADGEDLFWITKGGDLFMGRVKKDGKLSHDYTLKSGCKDSLIAAGGGFLYIKTGSNLFKHKVKGGVLQPGQLIDPHCKARVIGVDGEKLIWGDSDGTGCEGTVSSGQLHSDPNGWHAQNWRPDLFTCGPLGLFTKSGQELNRVH